MIIKEVLLGFDKIDTLNTLRILTVRGLEHLTSGFNMILMLGCMYFDKTRRIDDSFWPDGLSGSIIASICMLEFSLSTTMALYKVKIKRRVREA